MSITQTGILTLTLKLSLISCIPGFLIIRNAWRQELKWNKGFLWILLYSWLPYNKNCHPMDKKWAWTWMFPWSLELKTWKMIWSHQISIAISTDYIVILKKASFREFGTLIALNITKINRRGWIKGKIVLSSWGWLWSQRVVYGI